MEQGIYIPKSQEHLRKDTPPIFVCPESMYDEKSKKVRNEVEIEPTHNLEIGNVGKLDWLDKTYTIASKGEFPLEKFGSLYVMSPIDNADKNSEHFYACTGLVVVGKSLKEAGNISFLTHQTPDSVDKLFSGALEEQLINIKKESKDKTIDAIVFGGGETSNDFHKKNYKTSIKFLGEEVKKILGFEPIVFNGPKIINDQDKVYFDNENRRLYLYRHTVNPNMGAFLPSDIDKYIK